MKIRELETKQKIFIISVILLFITIFILLLFINPSNKYGDGITINNYDKYISNLPTDKKNSINSTLYKIVKNNLKSDKLSVNDASIRGDSVKYNYDKSTNINSGSFIVDMQSIKQSYFITYKWSPTDNNVNLSGYTATAACLSSDKLIYGDFTCIDDFYNSKSYINRDPILDYLPYSTFNYTVTATINKDNKADLDVNIILYLSDTRDGNRENSINKYKTEITDWIKLINLIPDNYLINYTISE